MDFGHHQAVANHPQAAELLEWAEAEGATVKQLREEKRRRHQTKTARAARSGRSFIRDHSHRQDHARDATRRQARRSRLFTFGMRIVGSPASV